MKIFGRATGGTVCNPVHPMMPAQDEFGWGSFGPKSGRGCRPWQGSLPGRCRRCGGSWCQGRGAHRGGLLAPHITHAPGTARQAAGDRPLHHPNNTLPSPSALPATIVTARISRNQQWSPKHQKIRWASSFKNNAETKGAACTTMLRYPWCECFRIRTVQLRARTLRQAQPSSLEAPGSAQLHSEG